MRPLPFSVSDAFICECAIWLGDVLDLDRTMRESPIPPTAESHELEAALTDLIQILTSAVEPYFIARWQSEGGEAWDYLDTDEEVLAYARRVSNQSFDAVRAELANNIRTSTSEHWTKALTSGAPQHP